MSQCLNPQSYYNTRKFLSLDYNLPFYNLGCCGKCANCLDTYQKEWYFRAYYEYLSCVNRGGYMLMDCLTYSEKSVPKLSRFLPDLPKQLDYMCFDYRDVRLFLVLLRKHLERSGYKVNDNLRYFFSTEYGTAEDRTHRPHIHLLLYCSIPGLDSLTLSRFISDCWKFGRTDGVKYKGRRYVQDMTIKGSAISAVRSCKYVSKYVNKSSLFQSQIDKRYNNILKYLFLEKFLCYRVTEFRFETRKNFNRRLAEKFKSYFDIDSYQSFLTSETCKKQLRDLKRNINQFHRQSLGFGASALDSMNIDDIIENNILCIPDGEKIVNRIGLPLYYRRKLFYEQKVVFDNYKVWQPTEIGKRYLAKRRIDKLANFSKSIREVNINNNLQLDDVALSQYLVDNRGRIKGCFVDTQEIDDVLQSENLLFSYLSPSDKKQFHQKFVGDVYYGQSNNYCNTQIPANIRLSASNFKKYYTYIDENLERQLDLYHAAIFKKKDNAERLKSLQERLNQVYKNLVLVS